MLSVYTEKDQRNWDRRLQMVLFAYRTSMQDTVRETPFRLVYGREARLPSDLENFVAKTSFVENIQEAWSQAKNLIVQAGQYEVDRRDKQGKKLIVKVGDKIRVLMPHTEIGLKTKLRNDTYQGPCTVVKIGEKGNIEIMTSHGPKWVHLDRVKMAELDRQQPHNEHSDEGPMALELKRLGRPRI